MKLLALFILCIPLILALEGDKLTTKEAEEIHSYVRRHKRQANKGTHPVKKRTKGWSYESTLPKCGGPRKPGRYQVDIKTVGQKKKCNRGKNIGEQRAAALEYLKKQIAAQNGPAPPAPPAAAGETSGGAGAHKEEPHKEEPKEEPHKEEGKEEPKEEAKVEPKEEPKA